MNPTLPSSPPLKYPPDNPLEAQLKSEGLALVTSKTREDRKAFPPKSSPETRVPLRELVGRVEQKEAWDCGLACGVMALRAIARYREGAMEKEGGGVGLEDLRKACWTESVWSIDLACLLGSYGVEVKLLTTYPGVNPGHKSSEFYTHIIDEDKKRVKNLFTKAESYGVIVEKTSKSRKDIQEYLDSGERLVLALIDRRKLRCTECASSSEPYAAFFSNKQQPFLGHFILVVEVVTGTHGKEDTVYYFDPNSGLKTDSHRCHVTGKVFDDARTAPGTDQDLIIIGANSKEK
ncbi:hypothetical protein AAMO2058_001471300 [Amorphochlora amoebiformis]